MRIRLGDGSVLAQTDFRISSGHEFYLKPESQRTVRRYRSRHPSGYFDVKILGASGARSTATKLERERQNLEKQHEFDPKNLKDARKKILAAIATRQGQGKFRKDLLRAYQRKCAVSECKVNQVLEAAHICPYRGPDTNRLQNGILLRADIHTLFDMHLLTVDKNYRVQVSRSLVKTDYYRFARKRITMPKDSRQWPSQKALEGHRKEFQNQMN